MTQDYAMTWAFVEALVGDPHTAVLDWRALHDTDKTVEGHARRGTLPEWWHWLCGMQATGHGIFACINEMDGVGRHLANVRSIRAHVVDLDNLSSQQNYDRTAAWQPAPSFAVNTSKVDGRFKYHTYWRVTSYIDNDRYQLTQRKLRQLFDGDKSVIDPTRVLRVPGFWHLKNEPYMVTMWPLAGAGQLLAPETLEAALAGVNVIDGGSGGRHELGDPNLAADSLDWIKYALSLCDPNSLGRGEWIAITSAVKQAGWSLTDETTLYGIWSDWCAQYDTTDANGKPAKNDPGENLKQWRSITSTELGWNSLVNRIPSLKAMRLLGGVQQQQPATPAPGTPTPAPGPMPAPPPLDCSGEMLTDLEQREWFKECVYVLNLGEILTGENRFLDSGQFNVYKGGKKFIIDGAGKVTNEAWAAATRSTLWRIPQVDHIRFLPDRPYGEVILDDLGRKGINTYRPIAPRRMAGDVTPFLWHIAHLLPDPNDQGILLGYLAHNVKFPGYKIPWAPLIQSVEGAGKGVIKRVIKNAMGKPYVYFPKATELAQSGAKFNAWLRNKLFILVDEIRVDEKRELIEVLKPLISEEETEVQAKGVDQDLEDNFSNWLFFSNFKDAVPISKNARRFAIMFSPLQTVEDLMLRQMGDTYFTRLYDWLDGEGSAIVTDYLLNYPIERGALPMRAPTTSSSAEAIKASRSPLERIIGEALEDEIAGFRSGWIGTQAVTRRIRDSGMRAVQPQVIETVLAGMGYFMIGRAVKPYLQENPGTSTPLRSYLFNTAATADVNQYGRLQGWD